MTNKKLIKYLLETNDPKYNLLKASEELQELALVLTQMALKKEKVDEQEVIDEIGDVKIRLKIISKLFNKQKVKERIKFKLDKFRSYIQEDKYKGGI
jgi:hypothetical protein